MYSVLYLCEIDSNGAINNLHISLAVNSCIMFFIKSNTKKKKNKKTIFPNRNGKRFDPIRSSLMENGKWIFNRNLFAQQSNRAFVFVFFFVFVFIACCSLLTQSVVFILMYNKNWNEREFRTKYGIRFRIYIILFLIYNVCLFSVHSIRKSFHFNGFSSSLSGSIYFDRVREKGKRGNLSFPSFFFFSNLKHENFDAVSSVFFERIKRFVHIGSMEWTLLYFVVVFTRILCKRWHNDADVPTLMS